MRVGRTFWIAVFGSSLSKSVSGFVPFVSRGTAAASRQQVVLLDSNPSEKEKNLPRHDVGVQEESLPEEVVQARNAFIEHQESAPKLGFPVDVRSLVQYNHGFAVMSTHSKAHPGFPGGSVVGFAPDEEGRPLFVLSGMSTHTQDILANPKCSVTIAAKDFKGAADGRVNLMGSVVKLPHEEIEAARQVYLQKHPGAFWVNFGDFNWFRMDEIVDIRFVGGFARAGSVTPDDYRQAKPDPILEFSGPVAGHMNEDHMDSIMAMVAANIPGVELENMQEAMITSVDSLGMYVKVTQVEDETKRTILGQPKQFKVRLPFSRPAEDRKDVKTLIVEMTRAAAASVATE